MCTWVYRKEVMCQRYLEAETGEAMVNVLGMPLLNV
jgi:hypothetical protein